MVNRRFKTLICDQGGVLSEGGGKGTNERAAAAVMGLSGPISVELTKHLFEGLKRGSITNDTFIAGINELYPDAPRPLTNEMWDIIYPTLKRYDPAYELVARCREEAGLVTGLLSNINPMMVEKFYDDGAYEGFNPLILSCEVKWAKPDQEIYELVEQGLPRGIEPHEILFFDDQKKCTDAAKRRGWHAVQVNSPAEMVQIGTQLIFG